MADTSPPSEAAWPPSGVRQGRADCRALLRQVLVALAPAGPLAGARQLWLADTDFNDWPLDDEQVLSALAVWLRQPGRQLRLVSQDFGALARAHPRFARWRRDWTHAMAIWAPEDGNLAQPLRGLLAAPVWLQRQDAPDWRIRCTTDSLQIRALEPQIADFLQRCTHAWPATTLGL